VIHFVYGEVLADKLGPARQIDATGEEFDSLVIARLRSLS